MLVLLISCALSAQLIFEDEFDTFDMKTWKHELTMGGGGNWEFQMYVNDRENSFVKDGKLHLRPTLTRDRLGEDLVRGTAPDNRFSQWGSSLANECTGNEWFGCERVSNPTNYINPIRSAKLRMAESLSVKYGRVEVRAKLPKGDWLWPAIWMMPRDDDFGNWPASGEIDIMESRGNGVDYQINGNPAGIDTYGTAMHYGPWWDQNGYPTTLGHRTLPQGTFNDDFHIFGLEWTASRMYFYLDDPSNIVREIEGYGTTSFWERGCEAGYWDCDSANPWAEEPPTAPFNKEFFLQLNLAVGGTAGAENGYFPDGIGNKPWSNVNGIAATDFYNGMDQWYPTWTQGGSDISEDADFVIDSVRVWGIPGESEWHWYTPRQGHEHDSKATHSGKEGAPLLTPRSQEADRESMPASIPEAHAPGAPAHGHGLVAVAVVLGTLGFAMGALALVITLRRTQGVAPPLEK